jgi:ribonuclease BN (tRNA processing enzyme)
MSEDEVKVIVQFLGSGDAFGSGGRFQTCICVTAGALRFLLDCGASSLIAMKRFGVDPSSIDYVLLSHLHGDHFGGIPFLIRETQIAARRTRPLVIAGPRGVEQRVRGALEILFPGSTEKLQGFPLQFIELAEEDSNEVGPLKVGYYPAIHTPGTEPHSLRVVCGGSVIAFSGDTEWNENLVKAAAGAHLFICEAFRYEDTGRNHLSYQTLLKHRGELDCERLVITHLGEEMLCRLGGLELEAADDGKIIILNEPQ